ncbi:hypothetical protein [Muribaculum gordoncarteri]|uniref:hypothetical protein n=1 Tax=Muribaculum gordoncarteri TaxID=2530390 RepID=UPI003F66D421
MEASVLQLRGQLDAQARVIVYEEDLPQGRKYAHVVDESIMINKEKLLVVLGVPAEHTGKPLNHDDVIVLGMHVGECFKRDDVKEANEKAAEKNRKFS